MSVEMLIVHNLREANGKTVKENNLQKQHTIPLKTFVEIDCDYNDSHGCRGFIAQHERDCDGTPLYGISLKPRTADDLKELEGATDDLGRAMFHATKAEVNGGWSEDALIVLLQPSKENNPVNNKIEELTRQMKVIYDADRDYDICLADLEQDDQDKYAALKQERDALLA